MSQIGIFRDGDFKALDDYNADDLEKLFQSENREYEILSHSDIEGLSRKECDILLLPYVRGNFSDRALNALLEFHSAGGSLFFLGDLPNRDKWYPLKNMQASLFHLTRCYDDFNISADRPGLKGLTPKGVEILGELRDFDFIADKTFPGLRITAFPPDETHPLLRVRSSSHTEMSSAIVAVDRKCDKFLGARFAQIGFIGGEPRENVDGAYQMEWSYDPGLLTREWKGIDAVVSKLVAWLEPQALAAAINALPVSREGSDQGAVSIRLKNPSAGKRTIDKLVLRENNKEAFVANGTVLEAGESMELICIDHPRAFGIHRYELLAERGGETVKLTEFIERVFPADAATRAGYGFSTYWAFQAPRVTDEFKYFCREMLGRGCMYIRVNVPWEDVEPAPGEYDWSITDQFLEFSEQEGFLLQFWMFPTTRGSGLADGGVPWWSLKEPAIDRDGNKGFFPSIWSPFYRERYFSMLKAFTSRYADAEKLSRFILDFGNSDFPYGYYYYGGDASLFDYSEFERRAFAKYLKEELGWNIETVNRLYGTEFASFDEVPVPFPDQGDAYRTYLDFRPWSIGVGIQEVWNIVRKNAPDKLPSDPPGHGLGSIADISTYFYEAKAKHWTEERKFDAKYTEAHNAGREWGGEAWQVGGEYRQYDEALFQSVRLNATYHSIPGADLGAFGDDIARIGFIRRTIMGAERRHPELAVFDRIGWNEFRSLNHVASRFDFPVDLIYAKHRYDFSCYKLMALPDCDFNDRTTTGGGGGMLVPSDEYWYWLLLESVQKGLNLLVFPHTCEVGSSSIQRTFLRQVFGLIDVSYGDRKQMTVEFPRSFGGGTLSGCASAVVSDGDVLLRSAEGEPVLIQRRLGKGSVLLAGYDTSDDSLDPDTNYEEVERLNVHTLLNLSRHLGIGASEFETDNLFVYKEMVHRNDKDYFLMFSHIKRSLTQMVRVRLGKPSSAACDIATGEEFPLTDAGDNWYEFEIELRTREGRYLSFHDGQQR